MRKFAIIVALGLALLLGLAWSAGAVSISDPWPTNKSQEWNLYQIANDPLFGAPLYVDSNAFAAAWSAGAYDTLLANTTVLITAYAKYAGYTQQPGTSPVSGASGVFSQIDSLGPYSSNGLVAINTSFSLNYDFCIADRAINTGANPNITYDKYTVMSYNLPPWPSPSQSNGLIFLDPSPGPFNVNGVYYDYHFIVAFEDGDAIQPQGDSDYNDLVLNCYATTGPVPIPPSAVLLGSGLLGLIGLGWWRRKS